MIIEVQNVMSVIGVGIDRSAAGVLGVSCR